MRTTPEKLTKRRGTLGNANQNKTTKEEGLRECHTKNQSEEMRDLQSAKKPPPRRTGQKSPKKQPEKATFRGERCP